MITLLTGIVRMLSIRLVGGDGEMEAGHGEIVFDVRVGITEIVTTRSGLEKLSGE